MLANRCLDVIVSSVSLLVVKLNSVSCPSTPQPLFCVYVYVYVFFFYEYWRDTFEVENSAFFVGNSLIDDTSSLLNSECLSSRHPTNFISQLKLYVDIKTTASVMINCTHMHISYFGFNTAI